MCLTSHWCASWGSGKKLAWKTQLLKLATHHQIAYILLIRKTFLLTTWSSHPTWTRGSHSLGHEIEACISVWAEVYHQTAHNLGWEWGSKPRLAAQFCLLREMAISCFGFQRQHALLESLSSTEAMWTASSQILKLWMEQHNFGPDDIYTSIL